MTARQRRRQRRPKRSVGKKILLALGVVMLVVGIGIAAAAGWAINIYDSAPSLDTLTKQKPGASSVVYSADGKRLGVIHADTVRQPVPQKDLPLVLKQATVAIEDRNFYNHGGIDPSAIIRAGVQDLLAGGKPVQGGSTITQQLVRNLYVTSDQDTLKRKIIEAHLANDLEDQHSKDWILAKYLNSAPYGTNNGSTAIGVQAAAQTYFSEGAKHLTLGQAALLAGLPQAPSEYNPFNNPKAAIKRRNDVLKAMADQGYISTSQYIQAAQADLGLHPSDRFSKVREPLIFDLVQQQLIDKYGAPTVRYGGLKVYTTIQPQLQAYAQQAVDDCAACYSGSDPIVSALASIDQSTGAIVALASTKGFQADNQFNLAAQAHRQPGSSFKPYVLATAIKQGIDPDHTYYDGNSPKDLTSACGCGPWLVHNSGDEQGGSNESLRTATYESTNVVFAQLGLDVGPDNFARMAYQMGITSDLGVTRDNQSCHNPGPNCFIIPANAIGGLHEGITPLEQADGYATLASGGVHHPPTALGKVVFPDGHVDTPDEEGNRVLTPGQAYTETNILEQVITQGTGPNANIGCTDGMAGKTGTTEDESDGWFVGYTPKLTTAVWVGHPNSRSFTGFGNDTAAPVWAQYMSQANGACEPFTVPSDYPLTNLSPFTSSLTVGAAPPPSTVGPTTTTGTDTNGTSTTGSGGGTGTGHYDPNLYQGGDNGIQTEPTPAPPPSDGGGGGNPGGGVGTG
jgi:penicillin-binding protein 1A